ncbi:unnamed protein product [Microthlaspi erraticum]|uniref:Uncharacterized protein n=1 Tax=Microthlaspi erraticum TaxID=1685480 RepID=A0A6D2ILN2_9BRAS|nr:unnamed protein product [Microthlaspi erraticum]
MTSQPFLFLQMLWSRTSLFFLLCSLGVTSFGNFHQSPSRLLDVSRMEPLSTSASVNSLTVLCSIFLRGKLPPFVSSFDHHQTCNIPDLKIWAIFNFVFKAHVGPFSLGLTKPCEHLSWRNPTCDIVEPPRERGEKGGKKKASDRSRREKKVRKEKKEKREKPERKEGGEEKEREREENLV